MKKLNPYQWKKIKAKVSVVFEQLEKQGLITLSDTGTTQEDGFADCSQLYNKKAKPNQPLPKGFCFYSRQDTKRAKTTGILPLSFWAAPDGNDKAMSTIGNLVVQNFENAGFKIQWNGNVGSRPLLNLID